MLHYILPGLIFGSITAFLLRKSSSWAVPVLVGAGFFVVNTLLTWIFLPVYSYGFVGLSLLALLNGGVILFAALESNRRESFFMGGILTIIGLLFTFVIPFFSTHALFHADKYRNLISVESGTFSTDAAPLDIGHVRRVDQDMATTIADKLIGSIPGLGSSEMLGTMHIQSIRGNLYWVAPLTHRGFFKWLANAEEGTRGYVIVSAEDENDKRLVTEVNGEALHLKYTEGSYLYQDPQRYLYEHGYAGIPVTDFTFEVDDNWRPYIVATRYAKKIGYAGNDAVAVVTIDVQTGGIKEEKFENAPKWVDRIQPEDFIISQLDDYGSFVHGFWNTMSFASNTDMMQTTSNNLSLVYGKDGRCYWYTGMTSHGKEESTSGFVLVDSRTKKARIYMQPGATELAARQSAEGLYQAQRYQAGSAVLYNVDGIPTYFMSMKDAASQIKAFAFVSVKDYNIVGGGPDLYTALESYRSKLSNAHEKLAVQGAVRAYSVTDTVLRKSERQMQDGTLYYLVLANHQNKLFVGPMTLSSELIVTNPGDTVTISYRDGGNEVVSMTGFDNDGFRFQKTKEQVGVENRAEEAAKRDVIERAAQNAESARENLTTEQKAELMKQRN